MKRTLTLLLLNAIWLLASAFFAAPYACEGGLTVYVLFGVAAVVVQGGLTYGMANGLTAAQRIGLAFLAVMLTIAVWVAGLFAADMQLLCRLF